MDVSNGSAYAIVWDQSVRLLVCLQKRRCARYIGGRPCLALIRDCLRDLIGVVVGGLEDSGGLLVAFIDRICRNRDLNVASSLRDFVRIRVLWLALFDLAVI